MRTSRVTESAKEEALKRIEAGETATTVAKSLAVSPKTIYFWKSKKKGAKSTKKIKPPTKKATATTFIPAFSDQSFESMLAATAMMMDLTTKMIQARCGYKQG